MMAIKKGLFQNYAKSQDEERLRRLERAKKSKYTHATVFESDDVSSTKVLDSPKKVSHSASRKKASNQQARDKQDQPSYSQSKLTHYNKISETLVILKDANVSDELALNKFLLNLQGHQKALFVALMHKSLALQNSIIEKITIKELMILISSSYSNTKLAISRLVAKGLLVRYKGKSSINGYYNLGFNPSVLALAKNIFQRESSYNACLNPAEAECELID